MKRSWLVKAFVTVLPLIAVSGKAQERSSQGHPDLQKAEQLYAAALGISAEEVAFRQTEERKAAALQHRLEAEEDFTAVKIVHKPVFKILVLAKGDAEGLLRRYTSNPLYEAKAVPRSRMELLELQHLAGELLAARGIRHGSDIDLETGTIKVWAEEAQRARRSLSGSSRLRPFVTVSQVASIKEGLNKPLR